MTVVNVTAFSRTEFARSVTLAYYLADVLGTDKFLFGNKGQQETWSYPILSVTTPSNAPDTAGTVLSSASGVAESAPKLTLDNVLKLHRWIPYDELDTEQVLNLPSAYGRRLGEDIGTGRITRILTHMMDTALTSGGRENAYDLRTRATLGEQTARALEDASANMTIAGVPLQGRWAALYPTHYNALARVETAMKTTMGGSAVVAHPQRQALMFADFTIITSGASFNTDFSTSSQIPFYDTKYQKNNQKTGSGGSPPHGDFYGVTWHRDVYAVRHTGSPIVRISDSPPHEAILVTARLHMGTVAIQPTALRVLEDDDVSY